MITFKQDFIFTGYEERISKKSDKSYILVNFLDSVGKTFTAYSDSMNENNFKNISQLDTTTATLAFNNYNNSWNLSILDIEKALDE